MPDINAKIIIYPAKRPIDQTKVTGPDLAVSVAESLELYEAGREILVALYLTTMGQLIEAEIVSLGDTNSSIVPAAQIARTAILTGASSVILIHNHPSGCPDPSVVDVEITANLSLGLELFKIKLLDHIIIGHQNQDETTFLSLREKGIFEE